DEMVASGIDSKRYKHYTDYIEGLGSSLEAENLKRNELLKRLNEKQKQLARRSVDRKVLEKLKNRRRQDYYREALRNLQKETDDMLVVSKARTLSG
ncbi:MAG: flagellar FliJ family protein, partial [Deltaproteobacteria bacterium]|nr:flagellar FliJ family protein [Deltaproteobacteria bacterium]